MLVEIKDQYGLEMKYNYVSAGDNLKESGMTSESAGYPSMVI